MFPFTYERGISWHCAVSTSDYHLLLCKQDLLFLVMPLHTGFSHMSLLAKRIMCVGKKGSAAAKDFMTLDQCFVTATRGNIIISRTLSNGPYRRETRHTSGNTEQLLNSRNHNIKFYKAIRKESAQSEAKRANEMGEQDSLLNCPALCSLAQILLSFCLSVANCFWPQKGAVSAM